MPDEKQSEAQAAGKRLDRAYVRVFGEEGKRSQDQQAVWEDFAQMGFERAPTVHVSKTAAGMIDPLALAYNEGKRVYFLSIQERIRRALSPEEPTKPTVKKE